MAYPDGQTSYPQGSDLSAFLVSAGFSISAFTDSDFDTAAGIGVDSFQQRTGRIPMLAQLIGGLLDTGSVQPRYFDPPSAASLIMDCNADFCRASSSPPAPDNTVLATALTAAAAVNPNLDGYAAAVTAAGNSIFGVAVFINGNLQIEGTNYWLMPYSQEQLMMPYRQVSFTRGLWPFQAGQSNWLAFPQWRQSVVVVAEWGYWYTLPDGAWSAMLQLGACYLLGDLPDSTLQSLMSMSQVEVTEKWDPGLTSRGRVNLWQTQADKAVRYYRRQVFQ